MGYHYYPVYTSTQMLISAGVTRRNTKAHIKTHLNIMNPVVLAFATTMQRLLFVSVLIHFYLIMK